jgi:hypothetical protein
VVDIVMKRANRLWRIQPGTQVIEGDTRTLAEFVPPK